MTQIHVHSRKDFRAWLFKHHDKENLVYVVKYKKHTGKPTVSHLDLMHEAICFGWIDTTVKKLDEDRYQICFRKRGDKARWSSNTLSYAKKMVDAGLMTPAGMKRYEEGLKKPTIDHGFPKRTPSALLAALRKKPDALKFYKTLSASTKKYFGYWVLSAKQEKTREKRIALIVQRCVEKKKGMM